MYDLLEEATDEETRLRIEGAVVAANAMRDLLVNKAGENADHDALDLTDQERADFSDVVTRMETERD